MPGFFDRLRNFFSGRGSEEPQPQEAVQELPQPQEGQELPEDYGTREDKVYFEPERVTRYVTSKDIVVDNIVKARWSVGDDNCATIIDIDDIKDLFSTVGSMLYYTIIIYGVPCNVYPGKEDQETIYLSYSIIGVSTHNAVDMATTPEDFADLINTIAQNTYLECWESVCKVSLVLH